MSRSTTTPVVLIIYKRPETTRRVFDMIRHARPTRLLVIADGPRTPEDVPRCDAARAIIDTIDWPCEVQTDYAESNLGLKRRVSSGIDWVFSQVDEAIILEDDCLPDITFFPFCEELLEHYRDESSVMHISGDNFLRGRVPVNTSYYFSRYPHIWGWATWRRAWQCYDVGMARWQASGDKRPYLTQFKNRHERHYWRHIWNKVIAGEVDTWDAQWVFACVTHNGMAALPDRNLVSNIGVSSDATNTLRRRDIHDLKTRPMIFPLRHPDRIVRNEAADVISVREAVLNPPSGSLLLDSARSIAKHFLWSIKR